MGMARVEPGVRHVIANASRRLARKRLARIDMSMRVRARLPRVAPPMCSERAPRPLGEELASVRAPPLRARGVNDFPISKAGCNRQFA
jgi:hypothetical protein